VANEVVAHFLDGRIVKGSSLDVDPGRPTCHVRAPDRTVMEVKLADLKALYFVKSLTGDPAHQDAQAIDPADARGRGAFRIAITFADGEQLVGLTVRYPPVRPFFFVLPADPGSNNIRILVNRAAVTAMTQPPEPKPA
jgi:hypothetical protein